MPATARRRHRHISTIGEIVEVKELGARGPGDLVLVERDVTVVLAVRHSIDATRPHPTCPLPEGKYR